MFEVEIPADVVTKPMMELVRSILHAHEGYTPVIVYYRVKKGRLPLALPQGFFVDGSAELITELTALGLRAGGAGGKV